MKRAILLRHASAEDAREDALRGLSARGREEAARAGSQIAALGGDWVPTRALCSSALRARATLERVRPALAALREVELSERLYLASAGQLLSALQATPDTDACVLVVAHEPGLSAFVRQLTRRAEASASAGLARGMPPGAFAALALEVACWREAAPACAELVAFARA
jgi:phosphohistidine phosphatase